MLAKSEEQLATQFVDRIRLFGLLPIGLRDRLTTFSVAVTLALEECSTRSGIRTTTTPPGPIAT